MSCDPPSRNLAFKQKHDFPFDLLCDTERAMSLAYGAVDSLQSGFASRISYIIGPDAKVQKAYPKVKAAAHPEEVLGDLI